MDFKESLTTYFPGAVEGPELTKRVNAVLEGEGFTPENTLFGYSTCSDEINRFVTNFGNHWGEHFSLGGLAGIPFVGKGGFGAYAHHMDDGGNLFVLYASHVGITGEGEVGKILRQGMRHPTTSCGAAVGAFSALSENPEATFDDPHNAQMDYILDVVRPHMDGLRSIDDENERMARLTTLTYEEARNYLDTIMAANDVPGKVAVLGGVQINTPLGEPDYFLVRDFRIIDRSSENETDLTNRLQ